MKSLQEQFAPNNACFGCGPANPKGLRIRSFVEGDSLVMSFTPEDYHKAFDNILSGGICGVLLDCHSNWCAAYFIMQKQCELSKSCEEYSLPCTVTAKYSVELLAPTPMTELKIIAKPKLVTERKAEIYAEILVGNQVTARCNGVFVAVKPGHPGYHRW